jgi:hypothetical protein
LLCRISEHIKAQNWYAVFMDFSIVVAGVFIGIQVANWNDARAEKIESERMITELVDDLKEMKRLVEGWRVSSYNKALMLDELLTQLDAAQTISQDEATKIIQEVWQVRVPPLLPAILTEVLTNARFYLLDNNAMRSLFT